MASVSRFHSHCFCLLKLTPIISDPEYLLDQHILICVKSTDSDESYGNELALQLVIWIRWAQQRLQFAGVLSLKERAVSRCEPLRSATPSFRSHWLTTGRRREHWQVASSYAPLRASPPRSYTVRLSFDTGRICSIFFFFGSWSFILILVLFSDFIKIERDDPIASKGKSGDLNK